jgi:hypothetical protein
MDKKPVGIIGVSAAEQGRFSSFHATLHGLHKPPNSLIMYSTSAVISGNRNKITEFALDSGAEWILYLDDDHILKSDTLTRLLSTGKDVISAHYIRRQPPFSSVLMDKELPTGAYTWKYLSGADEGIISVGAVGAGCLLVRRAALEALTPPYWTLGQIAADQWGDDLHFCTRLRRAGFDIFCDLDNAIGHIMSSYVYPSKEVSIGWTANQHCVHGVVAQWPMPLEGDF